MTSPEKDEIVSLVLALEEVGAPNHDMGVRGLKFLCLGAAQLIRRLRPDLAFIEEEDE